MHLELIKIREMPPDNLPEYDPGQDSKTYSLTFSIDLAYWLKFAALVGISVVVVSGVAYVVVPAGALVEAAGATATVGRFTLNYMCAKKVPLALIGGLGATSSLVTKEILR